MKCAICGKEFEGFGNNPYPIRSGENERCCDDCNEFVIDTRLSLMFAREVLDADDFAHMLNNMTYEQIRIMLGRKKENKSYAVPIYANAVFDITVEAENEEEAKEKALDVARRMDTEKLKRFTTYEINDDYEVMDLGYVE